MILYHLTDVENIDSILKNGIVYREDKHNTNGPLCKKGYVYLTTLPGAIYPYLQCKNIALIEVDMSVRSFYPDEDYIVYSFTNKGYTLEEARSNVAKMDLEDHKPLALDSLNDYGCVAVKKVKPTNIKRWVALDSKNKQDAMLVYNTGFGMSLSFMMQAKNYALSCSRKYKKIIDKHFNEHI